MPGESIIRFPHWNSLPIDLNNDKDRVDFQQLFKTDCYAVIVQRTNQNTEDAIPTTSATKEGFYVDTNDDSDDDQNFWWVAVGDCDVSTEGAFSIEIAGYILKGGIGVSTTHELQVFNFDQQFGIPDFPTSCMSVLTNRTDSGSYVILPVPSMASDSFTIQRNSSISGDQHFFWLAVGE